MKNYTSPTVAVLGIMAALIALALSPIVQKDPIAMVNEIIDGNIEYFAYGIVFFVVFTLGLSRLFPNRQLAKHPMPKWRQIWHESAFSICSGFVMSALGVWLVLSDTKMLANHYTEVGPYGWVYMVFTTLLLFILHDTAFATFSFHPLEAIVQGLNSLVPMFALLVMPWHAIPLTIFGLGVVLFNVIGHLGFEIYPKNWHKWPVLGWKTTAYHHYMHHQRSGGNYGLYFRFWDKLCGTEFKDYEARQEAMFERGLNAPIHMAPTLPCPCESNLSKIRA